MPTKYRIYKSQGIVGMSGSSTLVHTYHGDTIGLEEMALHIMNPPRTGHEGCGYEEVEMEKMILQTRCYLTIILLRLLPATTM